MQIFFRLFVSPLGSWQVGNMFEHERTHLVSPQSL